MTSSEPILLGDGVALDPSELSFSASRSGGPGGQNVNKVATRVTLSLDIAGSPSFEPEVKERLMARLAHRLTKDGVLSVSSQRERSQGRNRRLARQRLVQILEDALDVPPERRPTRVPRSAKRRRLENKRHRSRVKKQRRVRYEPED